ISSLFNRPFELAPEQLTARFTPADLDALRLPGHEAANQLVFVNGFFAADLSSVKDPSLVVLPLEKAASQYEEIVSRYLGDSSEYLKDGINALNTAFLEGGVFLHIGKGKLIEQSVYMYNITDARHDHV